MHINQIFVGVAGTLYIYEKGLIFVNPRFGSVVVPLHALSKMQFYDKESSSAAALVILQYHPSIASHLPPHLINNNLEIVVALLPRTKIFRLFYSDVLHLWKAEDNKPVLELISGSFLMLFLLFVILIYMWFSFTYRITRTVVKSVSTRY